MGSGERLESQTGPERTGRMPTLTAAAHSYPRTSERRNPRRGRRGGRWTTTSWSLRENSPAWRLLRADNAPLVLSSLSRIVATENIRSVKATGRTRSFDDDCMPTTTGSASEGSPGQPRPT